MDNAPYENIESPLIRDLIQKLVETAQKENCNVFIGYCARPVAATFFFIPQPMGDVLSNYFLNAVGAMRDDDLAVIASENTEYEN